VTHHAIDEYFNDPGHLHADGGSVAVSADGTLVWSHVRGLIDDDQADEDGQELWLVLDAADGRTLGHAPTMTVASGSVHTPHPDPTQMGLSIGEGEDGSPVIWGRWDGQQLTAEQLGIERILLAVSPSGQYLLTVPVGQRSLCLHQVEHGPILRKLDAIGTVPPHPRSNGQDRVYWDYEAAFLDEDTLVAGTSECDAKWGTPRHWLVDAKRMGLRGEICYPVPVSGPARTAGAGMWCTLSPERRSVQLWELDQGAWFRGTH